MPSPALPPLRFIYRQARERQRLELRENPEAPPPERFLQQIWHHQRLRRGNLQTCDGRRLKILHPGFWNHEPGPDFRQAILQFGTGRPQTGDVEIDLHPAGWRSHGHHRNPAFDEVILRVVWDRAPADATVPVLVLKNYLDASLPVLAGWLGTEAARQWPESLSGKCKSPLKDLEADAINALLIEASLVRLERKAAEFQMRAREVGWERSLWEGIFRALGYKHNSWPMQCLAEVLPLLLAPPPDMALTASILQGRLLGVSGLLPAELTKTETQSDRYLRLIWANWWRERDAFQEILLPRRIWRLAGVRPANHPQRRLALAAHWLLRPNFISELEIWMTNSSPAASSPSGLMEILQVPRDDFWSHHWTFRSARLELPHPLIGSSRLTDLAVNVFLPWFWGRAVAGKSEALKQRVETAYWKWPAAQDNAVLKLAARRLLGTAVTRVKPRAAMQQGLMQIVRDFCDHSNALCADCPFPALVQSLQSKRD